MLESLHALLHKNEALLLFLVIGIGYLVGHIKVRGFSLGVAGVLFVGLAFGAWQPHGPESKFVIPSMVTEIGLILFVYAIGLTAGPGFFSALREKGVRLNLSVIAAVTTGAAIAVGGGMLLNLTPGKMAGIYCGALTNTPALAATTELIKGAYASQPPEVAAAATASPAVGYSLGYPFGVLCGLLALQLVARIHRERYDAEVEAEAQKAGGRNKLSNKNYLVTNSEITGRAIGDLEVLDKTGVLIARVSHNGEVFVPTKYTVLHEGDIVAGVGPKAKLEGAVAFFGEESKVALEKSREKIDFLYVLVSNRKLYGKTIEELELDRRFHAAVTRVRRADVEMIPRPETVIEPGDMLRIVVARDRHSAVASFFGNSERQRAELDYTAITLGISLGVLVGMIPIPIPGAGTVKLGFAGGPLVVALILGYLGRTGPMIWSLPHEANMTLRHIGLLLFLAGVGILAGGRLAENLQASVLSLVALGAIISMATTFVMMFLTLRFAKVGVIETLGASSATMTQPSTLAKAAEMTKCDLVHVAYATAYPVAMVGKILMAQLIAIIGMKLGLG